jgi:hypothetical protein
MNALPLLLEDEEDEEDEEEAPQWQWHSDRLNAEQRMVARQMLILMARATDAAGRVPTAARGALCSLRTPGDGQDVDVGRLAIGQLLRRRPCAPSNGGGGRDRETPHRCQWQ